MPNTEPNSLPSQYDDWQEWRSAYQMTVDKFNTSEKRVSDELILKIELGRLGFVGRMLEAEMTFIQGDKA